MLRHLHGTQLHFGISQKSKTQTSTELSTSTEPAPDAASASRASIMFSCESLVSRQVLSTTPTRPTAMLVMPHTPPPPYQAVSATANWLGPRLEGLHRHDVTLAQHVFDLSQMEGPTCVEPEEAMSVIKVILMGENHRLNVYLKELQQICEKTIPFFIHEYNGAVDSARHKTKTLLRKETRNLAYKKQRLMNCLHELYNACHQLKNETNFQGASSSGSHGSTTKSFLPWHPWRFFEESSYRQDRRTEVLHGGAREYEGIAVPLKRDAALGRRPEHKSADHAPFLLRCPIRPGNFIKVSNKKQQRDLLTFFERHRRDMELDLMPLLTTQMNDVERLVSQQPRPYAPQEKTPIFL